MTPQTWTEGTMPNSQEFLDWFLTCPRDEQLQTVDRMLEASDVAAHCFLTNHKGLQQEAAWLRTELEKARHNGHTEAMRRLMAGVLS